MWAFWKLLFAINLVGTVVHAAEDEDEDAEVYKIFMKELDKDGDDMLTLKEILADEENPTVDEVELATKAFKKADKNGDGKIDVEELPGLQKELENEHTDL